MITYGFSIQGKSHIDRGVVCQDSSTVNRIKSGYYIGIVADGVGSAPYSDIGSNIAVKSFSRYCNENIQEKFSSGIIEEILVDGFTYAFEQVKQYAGSKRTAIEDFDTTLSAAVYDGQTVVYGHSGDGGIVVKYTDGTIKPITSRQKGADGTSVIPLRAGVRAWAFGTEENVASVLLATDGMLDGVFQPMLLNLPPDKMAMARGNFRKDHIYITAAEFFMNPYSVYRNRRVKDPDTYMKYFLEGKLDGTDQKAFLQCILAAYTRQLGKESANQIANGIKECFYAVWAVSKVTDDKSVVCMMNDKAVVEPQGTKYYEEPDWKLLQEKYEALLYGRKVEPKPIPDDRKKIVKTTGGGEDEKIIDKKDPPANRMGRIPALLIPFLSGCVLGSVITFFLISGLGKISGSAEKESKLILPDRPVIVATGSPVARSNEPTETPLKTPHAKGLDEKIEEKVKEFLDELKNLDVAHMTEEEKNELNEAVKEYGFLDYMNILMGKSIASDGSGVGSDSTQGVDSSIAPEPTEDSVKENTENVDLLVKIMKDISQMKKKQINSLKRELKRKLEKEYANYFEHELEKDYSPNEKEKLSESVRELFVDVKVR